MTMQAELIPRITPTIPHPVSDSKPRFEELDSLRGLAALSVVLLHTLFANVLEVASPGDPAYRIMKAVALSPLRILWSGGSAVILFFVLSGFVLSLPYQTGRGTSYGRYAIRRIFRIYPPYLVAVAVAVCLRYALYGGPFPGLMPGLVGLWKDPATTRSVAEHVVLGSSTEQRFDPVTWSLSIEMRVSLLIPFLMIVVRRGHWLVVLAMGLLLAPVGPPLEEVLARRVTPLQDLISTSRVVIAFLAGALVARHRTTLTIGFRRLPGPARWLVLGAGFFLYAYPRFVSKAFEQVGDFDDAAVRLCAVTLGAGMLIVAALGSPPLSRLLKAAPMTYLGRISYSLYLYHMVILLSLSYAARGSVPPWVILTGTVVLSILVADLAYRLVEKPSMALGHRLTGTRARSAQIATSPPTV